MKDKSKYVCFNNTSGFWFELWNKEKLLLFTSPTFIRFCELKDYIDKFKEAAKTGTIEPYKPKIKEPSCLQYLLNLLGAGEDFVILYDDDHCIGVNEKGIYERESNAFKKTLLSGNAKNNHFLRLEQNYSLEQVIKSFNLSEIEISVLKQYYAKNTR